jgi:spore maturation protein CgeB
VRSLRILIVDTYYPAFLAEHYAALDELADASYEEQWHALMGTCFGTADTYSHNLERLGHTAHEVVANCEPLQAAWAREHGITPRRSRFPRLRAEEVLVLAQAEAFEPDVVYCQNLWYLSRRALRMLHKRGALVAGQIASEMPPPRQLQGFDFLLTSLPHYVDAFRKLGVPAEYFRIGFDERVLARLEGEPRGNGGVVFAGALNRAQHRKGNELLERVARRVPIDFWGYDATGWEADSPILRGYKGQAWGVEMFRVLRRARVALNRHIALANGFANNMRLYEATGVGTLLLTEAKSNLAELFEPGEEVVIYTGEEDLVAQTRYYLDHEEERSAIAEAGQKRTLRDHTYARRMEELVPLLAHARGTA